MKLVRIIVFFLLLLPFGALADYGNISMEAMICKSDFAVFGKIVKLDTNYFYIKVNKYLLGKMDADTLAINKFVDWNCARRYTPYKVGQTEIVFFSKTNNISKEFELFGYGGADEFELPVFGDSLNYQIHYMGLQSYNLKTFLSSIKLYDSLINRSDNATSEQRNQLRKVLNKSSSLGEKLVECASIKELEKKEKAKLAKQIFPKPRICFGEKITDSIVPKSTKEAWPFFYAITKSEIVKDFSYELISCNYTIISNGKKETFRIYGRRPNITIQDRFKKLRPGDQVLLDDISIIYPNSKVMKYEDVSIFVGRRQ